MLNRLSEICDENILIGGDFNITSNPEFDKKGGTSEPHSTYRENLKGFMDTHDLVYIWRSQHHDAKLFTYFQKKPIILSRIDFRLIPSFLSPFIKADIKHSIRSDHSLILLQINSALNS